MIDSNVANMARQTLELLKEYCLRDNSSQDIGMQSPYSPCARFQASSDARKRDERTRTKVLHLCYWQLDIDRVSHCIQLHIIVSLVMSRRMCQPFIRVIANQSM